MMEDKIYMKIFKSNLLIGNYCNNSFEHTFILNEKTMTNIKIGENLTEETFEFFLLEFLTNSPSIKSLSNANSNFLIISEKFLNNNFKKLADVVEDDYGYFQDLNILDKEALYLPIITIDGIWNLLVIEGLSKTIKPEILKKHKIKNENDETLSAKLTYFIFDKLQVQNKENCKKFLDLLENFLKLFMKIKYKIDLNQSIFVDKKGLLISSFSLDYLKLKTFKIIDDTGLIIGKIVMDCIAEGDNMLNYLRSNDFNDYATEGVSLNNRDILKNKYSDALMKARLEQEHPRNTFSFKNNTEKGKQKEVIEKLKTRKTSMIKTNIDSLDSRKKMNLVLSEFFGNMKKQKKSADGGGDEDLEDEKSRNEDLYSNYKNEIAGNTQHEMFSSKTYNPKASKLTTNEISNYKLEIKQYQASKVKEKDRSEKENDGNGKDKDANEKDDFIQNMNTGNGIDENLIDNFTNISEIVCNNNSVMDNYNRKLTDNITKDEILFQTNDFKNDENSIDNENLNDSFFNKNKITEIKMDYNKLKPRNSDSQKTVSQNNNISKENKQIDSTKLNDKDDNRPKIIHKKLSLKEKDYKNNQTMFNPSVINNKNEILMIDTNQNILNNTYMDDMDNCKLYPNEEVSSSKAYIKKSINSTNTKKNSTKISKINIDSDKLVSKSSVPLKQLQTKEVKPENFQIHKNLPQSGNLSNDTTNNSDLSNHKESQINNRNEHHFPTSNKPPLNKSKIELQNEKLIYETNNVILEDNFEKNTKSMPQSLPPKVKSVNKPKNSITSEYPYNSKSKKSLNNLSFNSTRYVEQESTLSFNKKDASFGDNSFLVNHMKKEFNKKGPAIRNKGFKKRDNLPDFKGFPEEENKNEKEKDEMCNCDTKCLIY